MSHTPRMVWTAVGKRVLALPADTVAYWRWKELENLKAKVAESVWTLAAFQKNLKERGLTP